MPVRPASDKIDGAVEASERGEAGDDPVDPELLLTLTEALAATFDPGYH